MGQFGAQWYNATKCKMHGVLSGDSAYCAGMAFKSQLGASTARQSGSDFTASRTSTRVFIAKTNLTKQAAKDIKNRGVFQRAP